MGKLVTSHLLSILGGVSVALALTYLVVGYFPWPARKSSVLCEPVFDGHVTAQTQHFCLQAPTSQELKHARRGLERAVSTFRDRFGVSPKRSLLVLIVDDVQRLSEVSTQTYRNRGIHVLPFVSKESYRSSSLDQSDWFVLDDRGILRESNGAIRVSKALDSEDTLEVNLHRGDVIREINGTHVENLNAFRRRFEKIPPGDTVALTVLREEEQICLRYEKSSGNVSIEEVKKSSPETHSSYSSALAHEACHFFVADYADRYDDDQRNTQKRQHQTDYGHVALPDWMDEAAATLCEGPDMKSKRYRHLRDHLDNSIPLEKLFTMDHPFPEKLKDIDSLGEGSPSVQVITGKKVEKAAKRTRSGLFYAQTLSIGEFIHARGGTVALRTMVKYLASGRSTARTLRKMSPSTGLPSSVDSLHKEWIRWIESSSRYREN